MPLYKSTSHLFTVIHVDCTQTGDVTKFWGKATFGLKFLPYMITLHCFTRFKRYFKQVNNPVSLSCSLVIYTSTLTSFFIKRQFSYENI